MQNSNKMTYTTVNSLYHPSSYYNAYNQVDCFGENSGKYNSRLYESLYPQRQLAHHRKGDFNSELFNNESLKYKNFSYNYWSKTKEQQSLFPSTGMSHKRYLSEFDNKNNLINTIKRQITSPYQDKYDLDKSYNNSVPYPYTYTEYEKLKQKMIQKKVAEQKWLDNQISRLKREDNIQSKENKMKNSNKSSKCKDFEQNLKNQIKNSSKRKNFIDQQIYREEHGNITIWKKRKTNSKNKNQSQLSKKHSQKQKQKLSESSQIYSQHTVNKPHSKNSHKKNKSPSISKKLMKSEIHRIYLAERNQFSKNKPYLFKDQRSRLKTEYGNRYSYLKQRQRKVVDQERQLKRVITQEMIDNAIIFDELKQYQSWFEEDEVQAREKHIKPIDINDLNDSHQTPTNHYKADSKFNNFPQKYAKNLSDIKYQRPYNKILSTIEQRQKSQHKNSYNKYLTFNNDSINQINSDNTKEFNSSLNSNEKNFKSIIKQKLFNNKSQTNDMEIYKNSDQHYPVFSPYTEHKHLPQSKHNFLLSSADNKKTSKYYKALQEKKQSEIKNQMNVKYVIVDEIEKRKIQLKQHQNHPLITHLQPAQNNLHIHPPSHQIDHIGNSLRIQLQILKQQLEDKNKKVIDLELQLMQLKNSHIQAKQHNDHNQHDYVSTSEQIEDQNASSKIITSQENKQCQTVQIHPHLKLCHSKINEFVIPNQQKQMNKRLQRNKTNQMILKLQQKISVQEQAINNFYQDLGMYQQENQQLSKKLKVLQAQKALKQQEKS